jgi:hypothetical protein
MEPFELTEPFETDDGSLDGADADLCFCLGVEWAMFRQKLLSGRRFREVAISKNADRLVRMAERQGRFVEHHPYADGWTEIIVGDYLS